MPLHGAPRSGRRPGVLVVIGAREWSGYLPYRKDDAWCWPCNRCGAEMQALELPDAEDRHCLFCGSQEPRTAEEARAKSVTTDHALSPRLRGIMSLAFGYCPECEADLANGVEHAGDCNTSSEERAGLARQAEIVRRDAEESRARWAREAAEVMKPARRRARRRA